VMLGRMNYALSFMKNFGISWPCMKKFFAYGVFDRKKCFCLGFSPRTSE
jgi:hypothetical protein